MRRLGLVALVAALLAVLVLVGPLVLGMVRGAAEPDGVGVETAQSLEGRIQVEVLNAAGIPRLAQRGTDRLRDRGFDVVHYGNASGFHADTSLVLDRVGDADAAAAVARAIGVSRVRSAPDSTLYLAVTVILGKDWAGVEDAGPLD